MRENSGIRRRRDKRRAGIFALFLLLALSGSALYALPGRERQAAGSGETPESPAAPEAPVTPMTPVPQGDSAPSGGFEETALVTLSGRIAIKGSMPHTMVVLTVTDGSGKKTDYQIVGPLGEEIGRLHQNRLVTIRGRIVREALGPGFPAQLEADSVSVP